MARRNIQLRPPFPRPRLSAATVVLAIVAVAVLTVPLTAARPLAASPGPSQPLAPAGPSTALAWSNVTSSASPPTWRQPEMAYDPLDHEAVILEASSFDCEALTWVYQHGGWTNLTPKLSVSPTERYGGGMVYDARDGYLLLYGGETYCNTKLNDTWEFRNNTWTQLHPKIAPPSLVDFAMAYDSKANEVVLYGGYSTTASNATNSISRQTWTFQGGNWTRLNTTASPNGFFLESMTYDSRAGEIVLFGGEQERGGLYSNSTWTFNGKQWSELKTVTAPSRRATIGLAYDLKLGEVILFGGNLYNDTWSFSGTSGWTNLTPPLSASPPLSTISAVGMVYDPALAGILLFTGPSTGNAVGPGETWVLS